MQIVKAKKFDSAIVGRVHFEGWTQAYIDIFPDRYLNNVTPEKRIQEFID